MQAQVNGRGATHLLPTVFDEEELERRLKAEASAQWTPHAAVLIVDRRKCLNCGRTHTYSTGPRVEYIRRSRNGISRRLSPASSLPPFTPLASLPRRKEEAQSESQFCHECFAEDYHGETRALQLPLFELPIRIYQPTRYDSELERLEKLRKIEEKVAAERARERQAARTRKKLKSQGGVVPFHLSDF